MMDRGVVGVLEGQAERSGRGRAGRRDSAADPGAAERIASRVASAVGPDRFGRYFRHQAVLRCAGGGVEVVVPTGFVAELLERRFGEALRRAAQEEVGGPVRFRVDPGAFGATKDAGGAGANGVAPPVPVRSRPAQRAGVDVATLRGRLEDFIVGDSNRLAYTAAVRLTEPECPPGFTPLFIHGACGLGKTHLVQGLAVRFAQARPGAAVCYTTAEAFTNEYIQAVRAGKLDAFRRRYRALDLLCIDDVHFFSSKQGTQSELLHTFDAIGLEGSRVALASDAHPRQIARLSESLVSRFMSGIVVRLDPPDRGLRERIVRRLAERRGLVLEDPVVSFIASAVCTPGGPAPSVRDLEGALTRVEAVRSLMPQACGPGGAVGLVVARAALGMGGPASAEFGATARPRRPVRIARIIEEVCRTLRVEPGELMGRGRHGRVVLARSLTAYLSRAMTTHSFPEIARAMGRPNHSTIVTAVKRVQAQLDRGEPAAPPGDVSADLAGLSLAQLVERLREDVLRSPG